LVLTLEATKSQKNDPDKRDAGTQQYARLAAAMIEGTCLKEGVADGQHVHKFLSQTQQHLE